MHRSSPFLVTLTTTLATFWILAAASASQAGDIQIDFDFTGSAIDILGGALVLPPDGALTSATASATLSGDGVASAQPGPVALNFLTFAANVNGSVLGNVITGNIGAALLGTPTGTLSAGLGNAFFPGAMVLNVTGMLNCSGANCASIGPFPISVSGPQTLSAIGSVPVGNLNSVGGANVAVPLTITLQGLSAVVDLVGVEVNRNFVPSPTPTATATPTPTATPVGKKKLKTPKKQKTAKLKLKKQKAPKKLSKKNK